MKNKIEKEMRKIEEAVEALNKVVEKEGRMPLRRWNQRMSDLLDRLEVIFCGEED